MKRDETAPSARPFPARRRARRAIILAAGQGKRLLPHTLDTPKCLLDLGDRTILGHQMRLLGEAEIDEIVVVTGFHAQQVRDAVGANGVFVHNPDYASTNSIYSLWLAREFLSDPCLVLNGDVLFSRAILQRLLASTVPDSVVYDSGSGHDPEETKVRLAWHGRLTNIGKSIPSACSRGEYLGLMHLSRAGAIGLAEQLERLVEELGERSAWAPLALRRLLPVRPVFGIDVAGEAWIEIDFEADYTRAREGVLPRLRREELAASRARWAGGPHDDPRREPLVYGFYTGYTGRLR